MFRVALLLVLGVSAAFADAASGQVDHLIKQMQDRYNSTRTLSVRFVENYEIQGHRRPQEAGTLTLRKQGKMRWDYTHPAGKLFISDGKNVFLYTAKDNRVEKVPLKDTEDMRAPLAFLLGHLDMKKEFGGFQVHAGEGGAWLDALPVNGRVPYEKVRMLIAPDGSVRELKVMGRDQSEIDYSFSDEQLNPRVNEAMFHFQIPPGAEVVDAVEFKAQQDAQ
ncbi:MAG: outer membrane lipoprotein carrier protein LolA [Acidobacteriaceae bacterium]|nr:outer membrane lipoprotein carrier protein LolA [Acidobacteriaceae bacterium]